MANISFHTTTDVTDINVTKTRSAAEMKTFNEKGSPDREGGFTVTKTATGFDDNTHPVTSHVGPGHSSAPSEAASHSGRSKV